MFKLGRISDLDVGEIGCLVLAWAFVSKYKDNPDVNWRWALVFNLWTGFEGASIAFVMSARDDTIC